LEFYAFLGPETVQRFGVPILFETLQLWFDESARDGPENMAVDEWLLTHAETPVLRVYRWQENWGSLGYFGAISEARQIFPDLKWVRRWTGGGLVDHRADWTYTLVVPSHEALATTRGAESYRQIHGALAEVVAGEGGGVRLSGGDAATGAAACFENPVEHDLVDVNGLKRAGAGQRRTRAGLVHQGSVAGLLEIEASRGRAAALAGALARAVKVAPARVMLADIENLGQRYQQRHWTERR
jgi:lipoyl(octanoyl) transferase